nr:hypothetical protein CFP56_17621 [Quercus suber]
MTDLGLDKDSHNLSIVYCASQQLMNTQIFYNSIQLLCEDDVDMMLAVIRRTPQFIAFDLYVTVEAIRFNVGEGLQHTSGAEVLQSESTHENEHVQTYVVEAFDIDAVRDVYEEFIDNDGAENNLEFFDELQVEHNVDTCPILNPTPEWFTTNTSNNIHDPSPFMETCLTSWQEGDQPTKGMLLKNKALVQHALTMFFVEHNKKYNSIKSDFDRSVVSCVHNACLWSV